MPESARIFFNATREKTQEAMRLFSAFIAAAERDIKAGAATGRVDRLREYARDFRSGYMHAAYQVESEWSPDEIRARYVTMYDAAALAWDEISSDVDEATEVLPSAQAFRAFAQTFKQAEDARESMFRERGKRRRADLN